MLCRSSLLQDATVRYTKNGISDKQELSNTDCSKEEMNAVAEAPVTAAKQDIADECKMVRSDHLPDWSDAMNSLDAQTPEIEHFLVCILKAYESDEVDIPNKVYL
ncbi:unnamed protein product [Toxocara canis]|uniref:Ropporin-1-like protein n=1 Tax=Toxocara canis TaxID=6265 RepID=A0A183VHB0_TOXCA|nr:unnamed protein product [Toxocara canis]